MPGQINIDGLYYNSLSGLVIVDVGIDIIEVLYFNSLNGIDIIDDFYYNSLIVLGIIDDISYNLFTGIVIIDVFYFKSLADLK